MIPAATLNPLRWAAETPISAPSRGQTSTHMPRSLRWWDLPRQPVPCQAPVADLPQHHGEPAEVAQIPLVVGEHPLVQVPEQVEGFDVNVGAGAGPA